MPHLFNSSLLGAPVVDIDGTFFIQAGIFIALALVLHPLLFKPWLQARARRAEAIEGAVRKAETLREQAVTMVGDYDQRIVRAREQANDVRAESYREQDTASSATLAGLRESVSTETDAERVRIAAQAEQARAQLGDKVEELAQTIAAKLLGRAV
ncbi:MAG: ATP synthase F0 subunit B [Deltaproteobacteria bacterium]|nr:ATP synthase F0 subunit B [Nannocystaceae bacterium]